MNGKKLLTADQCKRQIREDILSRECFTYENMATEIRVTETLLSVIPTLEYQAKRIEELESQLDCAVKKLTEISMMIYEISPDFKGLRVGVPLFSARGSKLQRYRKDLVEFIGVLKEEKKAGE